MKKNHKRLLTLAILMASSPLYALNEIEVNHPVNASQYLSNSTKLTEINGVIGVIPTTATSTTSTTSDPMLAGMPGPAPAPAPTPIAETTDIDYFSFYAQAGEELTVAIEGGIGGAKSVDTSLAIFNNSYELERTNDNSDDNTLDPRIEKFKVKKSGIYYVGVTSYPRFFKNGGGVDGSTGGIGDYKLVISGAAPSVQLINIMIKPGSGETAPINPKSRGKVPVALLSDANFNALNVDVTSLTFGPTGNEKSLSKCNGSGEDIDADGDLDLVCHFENQAAAFSSTDREGTVRGKTRSGIAFEGIGYLKVVPK